MTILIIALTTLLSFCAIRLRNEGARGSTGLAGQALIVCLLLAGSASGQTTYRDPGGAFTVGVPAGWNAEKALDSNQVTITRGEVSVALQVNTVDDGSTSTPTEILDEIEQQMKQDTCSDMSERRDTAVAGYGGQYFMIVCSVPGHGRMADTVAVATTNGKILIEMTSSNPAQFSSASNDLQSIYGSFRLSGVGGARQSGGSSAQPARSEPSSSEVSQSEFIHQLDQNLWVAGIPSATVEKLTASSSWGRQRMENWCWAASVQMTLNMAGVRVTQEQVVERIYGGDVDKPANPQQIMEALSGWAPLLDGTMVLLNPRPLSNDMDMLNDLSMGWPLIVGLRNPDGSGGHAEVITAITYGQQPNGDLAFRSVILRDPWPYSPSREEMAWSEFVSRRDFVVRNRITYPRKN